MSAFRGGGPVGRTREFEELAGALRRGGPVVLVITGQPGSGRSHMIAHLRDAAAELGYRCIGVDEELVVDRTTTVSDVLRVLRALVGDPLPALADPATALSPGWREKVRGLVDRVLDIARVEREVFAELEQSAPLLMAVEGYSPNPLFGEWVRTRLIPELRETGTEVVLVVAGVEATVSGLLPLADASVRLGPLDIDEVRTYLAQRAATLRPPLSDGELGAYSAAAAQQPGHLSAFARVFDTLSEPRYGTS